MPRTPADQNLFHDSTMTFGQHLEELRTCLFKAIIGLLVGVCIGFAVGTPVVHFIETPVRNALMKHYLAAAQTKSFSKEELDKLAEAGYKDPKDLTEIRDRIGQLGVTFEVVYVDPKILLGQLNANSPKPAPPPATVPAESQSPATPLREAPPVEADIHRTGLKPIVLFRPVADDPRTQLLAMNSQEAFMIYMKASLVAGAILASPWIFYQIWAFVAAGLYMHERRYVHIFLPVSIVLFLAGASLAFFAVFEKVLSFLFSFNTMLGIELSLRINEWISFVLLLPLGFGVSFQLPLVMLFLERIGVFTVQNYLSSWRVAILAIFVLGMLLSPSGDPYSLLMMAGPLTILYFGGALMCRVLPRKKSGIATT